MDEEKKRFEADPLEAIEQVTCGEGIVHTPEMIRARREQRLEPADDSISDETAYRAALKRVSELIDMDPEFGTSEGIELAALGAQVEAYEAKHSPMEPSSAIDAIGPEEVAPSRH